MTRVACALPAMPRMHVAAAVVARVRAGLVPVVRLVTQRGTSASYPSAFALRLFPRERLSS